MDLAASFEWLGLQQATQPHFHVLSLEYPVTSLIPTGSAVGLRMEPPKAALHREEPCLDKYFLREQGFNFFEHAASRHKLYSNHGDGYYLFRLTTIWHGGGKREIQEFQIGKSGWKDLVSSKAHRSWTNSLLNLFSRSSDRAFFHVERQLQGSQHAPIGALKWNTYETRTINERLAINMREVQDMVELLCFLPLRDLGGVSDRVITVRLPCSHDISICVRDINSKSKAECIDMTCSLCGGQVLPNKDIVHAQHSVERRRGQRKSTDKILWKRIENERPLNNKDRIASQAPHSVWRSATPFNRCKFPSSVSPCELCLDWSAEASDVLEKLTKGHGASNESMATTVADLFNHLMRTVDSVLQDRVGMHAAVVDQSLFPGWSSFVRRWLERTVKLLNMPDYAG